MADFEEEQRKYEEALASATRELQRNGSVTSETNAKLRETNKAYAELKKNLSAMGNTAVKGLKGVGKTAADAATMFARGNRTFDSLIPIVDGLGGTLQEVMKGLPFVGGALAGVAKGVTEASKIMVGKMGEINTGFDALGKSGAIGADGATGLGEQFTRAGLSIQQYTEVTSRNSRALAAMGGTAYDGAERFSKAVGDLTQGPLSMSIRTLGYSAEDIGEITGNFMTQQTRLGLSQGMTQRQLAAGTAQYVRELDTLSKLTGQNAKELQDQSLAIQMETQFRSRQEQMIAEQGEAGREAARRLEMFSQSMGKYDPSGQIGSQIREIFATGGAPITDGAKSLMTATNGAIGPIIDQVKNGTLSMDEALGQVRGALNENKTILTTAGTITMEGSNVINQGTLPALYNLMNGTEATVAAIEETRTRQVEATDEITAGLKMSAKNIEAMNIEMDKLFLQAMPGAATVTKGFTDTLVLGMKSMNEFLQDVDWKQLGTDIKEAFGGAKKTKQDDKWFDDAFDWATLGGGLLTALGTGLSFTGVGAAVGVPLALTGASIAAGAQVGDYAVEKATGQRASGGPVQSGQPYVVGEKGPELFVPGSQGRILKNSDYETLFSSLSQKIENMAGPNLTAQPMTIPTPRIESAESTDTTRESAQATENDKKLMMQQNEKLDELISVVKKSTTIQGKMLSASYS